MTYVYPADEKDFFSFSFAVGFVRRDGAGGFVTADVLTAAVFTWTGVGKGLTWSEVGAFDVCVTGICGCCCCCSCGRI